MLSKKAVSLYDSINFYARYKALSKDFRREEYLNKTDKKEVIELLKVLGYSAKYFTGEQFYQILEEDETYEYYFHLSVKYGVCELIFGATNKKTQEHVGDTAAAICKDIELTKGQVADDDIQKASFGSYAELTEILKRAFGMYEDFKEAVVINKI